MLVFLYGSLHGGHVSAADRLFYKRAHRLAVVCAAVGDHCYSSPFKLNQLMVTGLMMLASITATILTYKSDFSCGASIEHVVFHSAGKLHTIKIAGVLDYVKIANNRI